MIPGRPVPMIAAYKDELKSELKYIILLYRMLDVFKSSLSCPKPLVMALKNQTDLNEKTIQAKYVNFRMRNPTGFLGK